MKFGLLTVTYSGLFYSGKALSLEEQVFRARELGFDALSIEAKRPVASPLDLSKAERIRIREVAADQDIVLCAIESLSNFTSHFMEQRENNLAMMRMTLDLAHDLGVDLVKVFAAWPGIVNDEGEVANYGAYERGNYYKRLYSSELRKWSRAVNGIKEVAGIAADMGITLALQNHAPVVTPGYEDVLSMLEEIDRKNLKLCLDVPLFYERQDDAYVRKAIEKCGTHMALTHYGAWNFSEDDEGRVIQGPASSFGGQINYPVFVSGLQRLGYDGYLVSEYCLPIIRNHKIGGIEDIDYATSLALKYMKQVVQKTAAVPA